MRKGYDINRAEFHFIWVYTFSATSRSVEQGTKLIQLLKVIHSITFRILYYLGVLELILFFLLEYYLSPNKINSTGINS